MIIGQLGILVFDTLPPKLGHIPVGVASSENNFVTKSGPRQPKSFFENTMGNPFLIFVCDDRNAPQKN